MAHSTITLNILIRDARRRGEHDEAQRYERQLPKAEARECARARELGASAAVEASLHRRYGSR